MRNFPVQDPGTPDRRSPARYLWWCVRAQPGSVIGAVACGIVWMVSQALMPATIGRAIDAGIVAGDSGALFLWFGILLALGAGQTVAGVLRHRLAVINWLGAAFRTVQVTTRQATRLGATLPKRLATGEVVSVGIADVSHIGGALDIIGRGAGAVVAIVVVGAILLTTSLPLGLIVLIGVPLMAAAIAPLLRPLHHAQQRQRDLTGELTSRSGDIVTGLRVLRGIGGERLFAGRYREQSQAVRRAGVRVARVESLLEGAQLLLPGLLVALVTWIGARFAVSGQISVGQLVAFYGYAVFLVEPMRTLTEAADKITKALVSARRVVHILDIDPELPDTGTRTGTGHGDLHDAASGLTVRAGALTAVAAASPEDARVIADRLGRFREGEVSWGGTLLRDLPLATVRRDILVADNEARLFSGVLREEVGDTGLDAAHARDIVGALPDGLDADVAEAGREFSGGQQQRLRLARALDADPEVLVLVEPTSAVDAHTEARIARDLGKARAGRTTVVFATSPLLLDRAEMVAYVEDGKVLATGTHRDLLDTEPRYTATVNREDQ